MTLGKLARLSVPVIVTREGGDFGAHQSQAPQRFPCVRQREITASVSECPSRPRTSRGSPNSFSSVATARLTAGCDNPSRRLAAVKPP